jgi:hypothetical protein
MTVQTYIIILNEKMCLLEINFISFGICLKENVYIKYISGRKM